jgi:CheY-like chemotaxis protein
MTIRPDSLSVLVVDEEPEILSFFAEILDSHGIRALLARNAREAVGIARRGYVPIDLILVDVSLKSDGHAENTPSGIELVDRVRDLRPEVRSLYMSAWLESGVIHMELIDKDFQTTSENPDDDGLIKAVRNTAVAPLVRRMGSVVRQ